MEYYSTPELYIKNSVGAQKDADYVFSKYSEILKNPDNHLVLDIGCGPGNVTYEKILPLLPHNTRLIGIDISGDKVEYARKHYQQDTRLCYQEMDVLTETVPSDYVGCFDLAISVYCFHLFLDQRKALNNIYKMLKPSGTVLISFIRKHIFSDIYHFLYENSKWKTYMTNFESAIAEFHHQSIEFYRNLCEEIGFKEIQCEEHQTSTLRSKEKLSSILKSINLFPIPDVIKDEFIQSELQFLRTNGYTEFDDQGVEQFKWIHNFLVITAKKPIVLEDQ